MKYEVALISLLVLVGFSGYAEARQVNVNCRSGDTLGAALRQAQPGDTILVRGVCRERVRILKDRITVRGVNGATIDGGGFTTGDVPPFGEVGVIEVDGAQGVRLSGLTVRNGPAEGILAKNNAAIVGKNLRLKNNGSHGIAVLQNSHAVLGNVSILRSGLIGLYVFNGSSVLLEKSIKVRRSGQNGIAVDTGSSIEVRGANVVSTNNQQDGISIESESALRILGAPQSEGTTLIARDNGNAGLFLGQSTMTLTGGEPFAGNFMVDLSDNGSFGMLVPLGGAIISPRAAVRFTIANNPAAGMLFQGGSSALIVGGLDIQNNGAGIIGDGADDLTLVNNPDNPSAIINNLGVDVTLSFGTHATISEVTIGTISCDATVLIRGNVTCP